MALSLFVMKILDSHIGTVRLMVWEMTEDTDDVLHRMPCPPAWLHALEGMKSAQRRREFVFVRYLFFLAFGRVRDIAYGPDGRPFLADGPEHISISHSGGYAAIAWCADAEVGLDVEVLGGKVMRVRERFLGAQELAELRRAGARKHHLYWSAKEAIYKIAGAEAVDFSRDIRVEPFRMMPSGGCFRACLPAAESRFRLDYRLAGTFVLVLARRETT